MHELKEIHNLDFSVFFTCLFFFTCPLLRFRSDRPGFLWSVIIFHKVLIRGAISSFLCLLSLKVNFKNNLWKCNCFLRALQNLLKKQSKDKYALRICTILFYRRPSTDYQKGLVIVLIDRDTFVLLFCYHCGVDWNTSGLRLVTGW